MQTFRDEVGALLDPYQRQLYTDICLVPQLGNARRFKVDVAQFPRLLRAEAAAMELAAFRDATPDRQADAE